MTVISQAELAAMRRVTPTQLAEAAYAARQPRALSTTRGPSGIDIPHPNSTYRPTLDGKLLMRIAVAAFAAWSAEQLPAAWVENVADDLATELRRRYPPADMAVLAKYGLAQGGAIIFVEMGKYGMHKLRAAKPVRTPNGVAHFRTGERGSGEMIPETHLPFFDRIVAVQEAETNEFKAAANWPSGFKAREGRWPTWVEIEVTWPRLGAWMAEERRQAR